MYYLIGGVVNFVEIYGSHSHEIWQLQVSKFSDDANVLRPPRNKAQGHGWSWEH